jgi:hypothetical protein
MSLFFFFFLVTVHLNRSVFKLFQCYCTLKAFFLYYQKR